MAAKETKTQAELEAPAKVYQLDALDTKVSDALKKLDTILDGISGVATTEYVDAKIKVAKDDIIKDLKQYVDDENEKIHLEYRPIKKGALWFAGVIVVAMVGVVVTAWNAVQKQ